MFATSDRLGALLLGLSLSLVGCDAPVHRVDATVDGTSRDSDTATDTDSDTSATSDTGDTGDSTNPTATGTVRPTDTAEDSDTAGDTSDTTATTTPDTSDTNDTGDTDTGPTDTGAPSDATVTVGAPDRILLIGTVVTPDTTFEGQVLVIGEDITCAEAGSACASASGAAGATVIDTAGGVIAPGMIDTHNHILFDIFDDDDWLPTKQYVNHTEWTKEPRYQAMLDVKQCLEDASQGKPAWCPTTYDSSGNLKCEMDKWGELKGVIAGTTSIVGLPGTSAACFGSLARSIDVSQNDLDGDHIQTSAIFPPSKTSADGVCANFADGDTDAYLVHVGEGTNAAALAEFAKLGTASTTQGCLLAPQTAITHGTALTATEFATMGAHQMKLTWSPASNVALYGTTTNIPAALFAHLTVSLAPDWSMGGSQNLLDEMAFADAWDDAHFGNVLTAKDLVLMTTKNAAQVLAIDNQLGTIEPGMLADLVVYNAPAAGQDPDPYRTIVMAKPANVLLTMVGGRILYGDAAIAAAAPSAPACEPIAICGASKFACVAETDSANKFNQTYADIRDTLEGAMLDIDAASTSDGFNFAPLAPVVRCE